MGRFDFHGDQPTRQSQACRRHAKSVAAPPQEFRHASQAPHK